MSAGRLPRSVSVLMPTYQAERFLEEVLAALAAQVTDFPWDFTALDCASTDRTLAIFARFAATFPVPLRVVPIGRETFDHGDTRNLLAAASAGELLVYLTDDAVPIGANWLASIRDKFADERIAALYCRQVPRPGARPGARVASADDPVYSPIARDQRLPSPRELVRLSPHDLRSLFNYCDTASALRREIWERHPYPRGMAEDVRLARGLIEGGCTVRFDASIAVHHSHEWPHDRLEARARLDGAFNAEFFGRICFVDEPQAREAIARLAADDRARLEALRLNERELEHETAWLSAQRAAFVNGLLDGGGSTRRERPTAMLADGRFSALWITTEQELVGAAGDRTFALASALRERGHRIAILALAEDDHGASHPSSPSGGARVDVGDPTQFRVARAKAAEIASAVRSIAPDLVHVSHLAGTSHALLCEALRGLPAIVAEPRAWRLYSFGLTSLPSTSDNPRDRIAFRDEARPDEPDLEAAIHEYRYRAELCRARSTVLVDRFACEADRKTGVRETRGSESVALGAGAGSIEFDVVRGEGDPDAEIRGGEWRIEIDVEMRGSEVEPGGTVSIDGAVVMTIAPRAPGGQTEIVRLTAPITRNMSPRVVKIENRVRALGRLRRAWEPKMRLRIRRVRIVRAPAPPALGSIEPRATRTSTRIARDTVPVSIVVPHLDGRERLESCLAGIEALEYPREKLAVIVVDNASRDGTAEIVARHSFARCIVNARNLGFTVAANQGAAAAAEGSMLVFLNDDCIVEPEFVRELVEPLVHEECAATAARMSTPDGEDEFTGGGANFQGIAISCPSSASTTPDAETPRRILFPCGGAMAISPRVFHASGGFDADFFAYYDDLDLGWRLNLMGHDVRYVPTARCRHARSSTSKRFPPEMIRRLQIRNSLVTCVKNYGDEALARVLPALLALAERRMWIIARVANDAEFRAEQFDLHSRGARTAKRTHVPIERRAYADMLAINDFLGDLGRWLTRRAEVQALRKRDDAEILPLFIDPLACVEGEPGYVELQRLLIERCRIAQLFEPAR